MNSPSVLSFLIRFGHAVVALFILFGNSALGQITYDFTTFAGTPTTNQIYPFSGAAGIAVESDGELLLTDSNNNLLYEISGSDVTIVAGTSGVSGSQDGYGTEAQFRGITGVVLDGNGNAFLTDLTNNTVREYSESGYVSTIAGVAGSAGSADGTGNAARFNGPQGIALDSSDNLYVADTANDTIRKITPGGVVTTFAGSVGVAGSTNGTGTAALFNKPRGVAVDANNNVYVADSGNDVIRKITPAGVVTTLAGSPGVAGSNDGSATAARFNQPAGIAADTFGYIYVSDTLNDTIRRISASGAVVTLAGAAGQYGSNDGVKSAARFNGPVGLSVDGNGNIFVADTSNNTVREVSASGLVSTVIGAGNNRSNRDGNGSAAQFNSPDGVAVDLNGNVFVGDTADETIRKISPTGVVTTLAGSPGMSGTADGTGSAARFFHPTCLAIDASDNIYVADTGNNSIRKVTPDGVVTTFAGLSGPNNFGSADGTGTAARFYGPTGIAVDGAGNVYVGDTSNETIRKITPGGVVSTLAGTPGVLGSNNGTGAAAQFHTPVGVAVDLNGYVYVADGGNDLVRKISPAGVVTTLAGITGESGSEDGTGTSASFYVPQFLTVDLAGNIFVSDTFNFLIRKITPAGVVTTIGGEARDGGSEDGVGEDALFYNPFGIAVDVAGDLYIADFTNSTIRMGTSSKAQASVKVVNATTGYDGNPHTVTATTNPSGLNVVFFYNGSSDAPTAGGEYTVLAAINDPAYEGTGIGSLTITKGTGTVTLGNLTATYDGTPHPATATTSPPGLNVTFTYGNGSATPPTNAGSYKVVGTINDSNYQGTLTGTLMIAKSTATVNLSDLTATYTGKAILPMATTDPAGLPVTFSFTGIGKTPTNAGSYPFTATINSANAAGNASGTFTINRAAATVTLGNLSAIYSGKPIAVTVATLPAKLAVAVTYGGIPTPPSAAGAYPVLATITNPNYTGSAAGTLTIARVIPTGPALVSASGAQVGFSFNPGGVATMAHFQYGTDANNLNLSTPQQSVGSGRAVITVNGFLTGLQPNTTYYYEIVTVSSAGPYTGPEESFTTLGFDTTIVAMKGDIANGTGGALYSVLGHPAVNDTDGVAFASTLATGGPVTSANDMGIWANQGSATLVLIVQTGATAPDTGGATWLTLSDPLYNNGSNNVNNSVAFNGALKVVSGGATKTTALGVWSTSSGSLRLIARAGDAAPGSSTFKTISATGLSDANTIVVATTNPSSAVSPAVTAANDFGIWEGTTEGALVLKLATGEAAGTKTIASLTLTSAQTLVQGQTRDFASNSGDLAALATFTDKTTGVVTSIGGSVALVNKVGDAAPGANAATFAKFSSPIINNSDHVAFAATLATGGGVTTANDAGIWAENTGGTLELIARTGDPATGFATLGDPVYNNKNAVAFEVTSKVGKTTVTSIVCNSSGTLEFVAQTGDQAPGCPEGVKFSKFTSMALPDAGGSTGNGGVVFLGTVAGTGVTSATSTGIWAIDNHGDLQLVVRTGEMLLPGKTLSSLAFLPYNATLDGQTRSFALNGDLAYLATFSDKSTAIFNVVFP
jgi:hypothetical protein